MTSTNEDGKIFFYTDGRARNYLRAKMEREALVEEVTKRVLSQIGATVDVQETIK